MELPYVVVLFLLDLLAGGRLLFCEPSSEEEAPDGVDEGAMDIDMDDDDIFADEGVQPPL